MEFNNKYIYVCDCCSYKYFTPLMRAIFKNDINYFLYLIKFGANIYERNLFNKTVFDYVLPKSEFYDYLLIINRVEILMELEKKICPYY